MEHDGDGVENYSFPPKADPPLAERKLLDYGTSNVPPLEEYIVFTMLYLISLTPRQLVLSQKILNSLLDVIEVQSRQPLMAADHK